jgi:hypothetical protein
MLTKCLSARSKASPSRLRFHFGIVSEKRIMLQKSSPMSWRGISGVLFPALLLLPVLHLHPATMHVHGPSGPHAHAAVVHADFFLSFAPDHSNPRGSNDASNDASDDASSYPRAQIGFSTLLPRHLALVLPAFTQIFGSLPTTAPVLTPPFAPRARLLARDHAPPVRTVVHSPSAPRSPPRVV